MNLFPPVPGSTAARVGVRSGCRGNPPTPTKTIMPRQRFLLRLGVLGLGLLFAQRPGAFAADLAFTRVPVTLDRWMYPFNGMPGSRSAASTFGSTGDDTGVDTRHGQFLLGWNTASLVPTNAGPVNYLVRRAVVSILVKNDRKFALDPTHDSWRTFLPVEHPLHLDDADAGAPVELFGAGFRNGFAEATFLENSAFGSSAAGGRNAFATSYDTNGVFVDVGNNVGKTPAQFAPFEAWPFAVGDVAGLAPGVLVPVDSLMRFEIDLTDPLVVGYLQRGLDAGRLRFMVSSLHGASFGGEQSYPDFHTRESLGGEPPVLDLEVTVVSATDSDGDGVPDDWERHHFTDLSRPANGDSDSDGLDNLQEWRAGTNPTNAASSLKLEVLSAGGGVKARFNPAPSRRYTAEVSTNLPDWRPAEGRFQFPTPGVAEWHPATPAAPASFFRIQATPEPSRP